MREFLRNGKLLTLMLGHFTVDSYVGVIPVLYPLLIGRFHLSLATVGLVSLAYGGMAAISQPLFGLLADRFRTRFTGLALACTCGRARCQALCAKSRTRQARCRWSRWPP